MSGPERSISCIFFPVWKAEYIYEAGKAAEPGALSLIPATDVNMNEEN